ncbi:hypothetical protein L3i23_13380 [Herbiconiux sp. L3-i23]|nr:hypothetical protein L3i23_13380 [Herbiconiux sp. L3-i23]
MKVAAYHSSNYVIPHVHHTYDDCPSGKQIPSYYKVSGTGGLRLCDHCAER